MKFIRQSVCALALVVATSIAVQAATISWKGHTWNVNAGDPIGDGSQGGQISGSASNVSVDSNGYLHLKISGSGSTAKGAELYSADNIGFGSIYYVISGPITAMQKQVVASGFTYGPANGIGVDGENELDVEFSQWNGTAGNINGDFTFYPNTGHGNLGASYEDNWLINLGGSTVNTVRIDWSSTKVTASIWTGVVPPTASTSTAVKTGTFNGNTSTIPQSPCPMLFNLWTFGAYPTQALDIAFQDFQFIPQGTGSYAIGASAGTGGTISPPGTTTVVAGGSQTYTITPNSGFSISSVTVDGVNKGAVSTYTFTNVQGPHTIAAAFTQNTTNFTITASAGTGGNISPAGAVSVASGSSKVFTITPNSGFTISSVTVDGASQGAIGSYTFSNVTANHTISAAFSQSTGDTNIAPSGTGYLWSKNTTVTSNSNRAASTVVNDNNTTAFVVVNPAGEGGTAKWEGGGVVWSTAKTISSAKFVNGGDDGFGNGYFQSGCALQFSTDGTTWTNSGWTISPAYPNSTAAFAKTYTFTGTAVSGVKGVRVVGQTGASSWSWTVSEVQAIGH